MVPTLDTPGGEIVDFYDGGDHVHIWGLKFKKDEHIWGSEILRTEKKYLGSKIDGKITYLGSEILRAERKKIFVNELGSLELERKVFQNTIVNKKQFLKKNWST